MRELLKTLCSLSAVSGSESELRDFIIKEVSPFAECTVDKLGNIICFKKGKSPASKKVMVDAHIDEVGIIATSFTADGFVKFQTVGGIDPAVMLCRSVIFENGTRGVVGLKPVHLSKADERKKLPDLDSLYIDIGVACEEDAEKLISVGDTAVFESEFELLGENNVKAKALDDRAGVSCLISLLKDESEYDFYATFTAGEEVGCRGARTAAFGLSPDCAIVLEATTAADLEGVPEENKVCCLGKGPAISFMDKSTLYDRRLYDAAINSGLLCQPKSAVAGGNNSGAIHLSKDGVPTLSISLPCRYIHSPSSVASLLDLEAMRVLAKEMLKKAASGEII
ncbi:MAG: M42 family peptidase [Clostridia bacterium]|nr:M42 family peptidase [Clostridia bacterium]